MSDAEPQQPDLSAFLQQAAALQAQLMSAREELAQQVIVGQASGGAVRIEATGAMEFRAVHIDPAAAGDVEILEDLVLAALHDVVAKVNGMNEQAAGELFS